ncbi:MAG TPA: universal stress protein [Verrucomicrobiae bacterium]|nr:universal stress protein [Verrucomicrobiae bacterium]
MKTSKPRTGRPTSRLRSLRTPPRKAKIIDLVPALISIRSILVPVDFSETSTKAVHYAIRMAEQFGAKIVLMNVVEPIVTPDFAYPMLLEPDKLKAAAKEKLEALSRDIGLPGKINRCLVRSGAPFAEITDAARALNVDLIILATHGYTGLKHVLMGSTAERVVRHAPCPVLTVREKEHEFI